MRNMKKRSMKIKPAVRITKNTQSAMTIMKRNMQATTKQGTIMKVITGVNTRITGRETMKITKVMRTTTR